MQCCNVAINNNYQCDKTACTCIPTNGKSCICISEKDGIFTKCDDCKCISGCQCKCDKKCTCVVTDGAKCICVRRDEEGNIKTFDCCKAGASCCKAERSCCKDDQCCRVEKTFERKCKKNVETSGCCKVDGSCCKGSCCKNGNNCGQEPKQAVENASISIEKSCVCLPTGGKSCICVCKNEKGDIVSCNDCKCYNNNCQCCCSDGKISEVNRACCDKRGCFKAKDHCCTKFNEPKGNCDSYVCIAKETNCVCCIKQGGSLKKKACCCTKFSKSSCNKEVKKNCGADCKCCYQSKCTNNCCVTSESSCKCCSENGNRGCKEENLRALCIFDNKQCNAGLVCCSDYKGTNICCVSEKMICRKGCCNNKQNEVNNGCNCNCSCCETQTGEVCCAQSNGNEEKGCCVNCNEECACKDKSCCQLKTCDKGNHNSNTLNNCSAKNHCICRNNDQCKCCDQTLDRCCVEKATRRNACCSRY